MSSYLLFCQDKRQDEHIATFFLLGKAWNELPETEKEPYELAAKKARKRWTHSKQIWEYCSLL